MLHTKNIIEFDKMKVILKMRIITIKQSEKQ